MIHIGNYPLQGRKYCTVLQCSITDFVVQESVHSWLWLGVSIPLIGHYIMMFYFYSLLGVHFYPVSTVQHDLEAIEYCQATVQGLLCNFCSMSQNSIYNSYGCFPAEAQFKDQSKSESSSAMSCADDLTFLQSWSSSSSESCCLFGSEMTPLFSRRFSSLAVVKSSFEPNSSKPASLSTATPLQNMTRQGRSLTWSFTVKKGASCSHNAIFTFIQKNKYADFLLDAMYVKIENKTKK